MSMEESVQMLPVQTQDFNVFNGHYRCGSRSLIQQGKFTEKMTRPGDAQDQPVSRVIFYENFRFSGSNNIERVARFSVLKDHLAFWKLNQIEVCSQCGFFFLIQQHEKRDFRQ